MFTALMMYLLMGIHGLAAVCFGADGHVGVESVLSAHHVAAAGPVAGFLEGRPCAFRGHSPCLDVSIDHGVSGSAQAMERADAIAKVIAGSASLLAADASRDADGLVDGAAGWSCQGVSADTVPTSAVVRSTVLRI